MLSKPTIAVIGGTGKSGMFVVRELIRQNIPFRLLLRTLAASEVDWTLVRLPLIGLTADSVPMATSLEDCPGTHIHGTDLARFLVDQLTAADHIRQAPFLANPDH